MHQTWTLILERSLRAVAVLHCCSGCRSQVMQGDMYVYGQHKVGTHQLVPRHAVSIKCMHEGHADVCRTAFKATGYMHSA